MLLAAIGASAWNIVGGYAGQVSVGHAVFFGSGAYAALVGLSPTSGCRRSRASRSASLSASLIAAVIGVPTLRLSRPLFQHGDHRRRRAGAVLVTNWPLVRRGARASAGPPVPRTVLDLSFTSAMPYYYIFLAVLALLLGLTWRIERSRMGFYLRAIKDTERAARSPRRRGRPLQALRLHAERRLHRARGLALRSACSASSIPKSGFGILISVKMVIMAALGGAGRCSARWSAR